MIVTEFAVFSFLFIRFIPQPGQSGNAFKVHLKSISIKSQTSAGGQGHI